MEETIGVTQSEPTKNFPVWIKTAIDDRSSRFNAALASITHTDLIDPELVIEVKNTIHRLPKTPLVAFNRHWEVKQRYRTH